MFSISSRSIKPLLALFILLALIFVSSEYRFMTTSKITRPAAYPKNFILDQRKIRFTNDDKFLFFNLNHTLTLRMTKWLSILAVATEFWATPNSSSSVKPSYVKLTLFQRTISCSCTTWATLNCWTPYSLTGEAAGV